MITPKGVSLACLLSLASPGVTVASVTMRLLQSRQNSTYISIPFTDSGFQRLYLCMSMNSTVACSFNVSEVRRGQVAFVTYIQPRRAGVNDMQVSTTCRCQRHAGVDDMLSAEFTCAYTPQKMSGVCSRMNAATRNSNTSHTSFRLQDPCCHDKCVCLVWNDAKEQLIYDNTTLEICDTNCSLLESELEPPTTPFFNETSHGQELNSRVKDMPTSVNDYDSSLVVALVVSGLIVVDIIIIVFFMLYKRYRGRNHMGDNKVVEEKRTINTGSFRTLEVELPTEYVNTNQSRLYSRLEFVNGITTEQYDYAMIEYSEKSQNTDEYNTHNVYEETELCEPAEVPRSHYINSSDNFNKLEDDGRPYSSPTDSYTILEDLTDDSSEVNRQIKRCSAVETLYIYLNDESTDENVVKADTESDNSHANDYGTSGANVYANTEASVDEEVVEYTNVL
ncbi:hypothetical protein BsWGS_25361 [Bradybaena similaris]